MYRYIYVSTGLEMASLSTPRLYPGVYRYVFFFSILKSIKLNLLICDKPLNKGLIPNIRKTLNCR